MTILYNKEGIAVDIPEASVEDALKSGFSRTLAPLSITIKNYDPDIPQNEIPLEIQGTLKQVEFILWNRSNSVINLRYGDIGNETIIPGGIPVNAKLRITAFTGSSQVAQLPTVNLTSSDSDNFVELESSLTFTATQVNPGTIAKVEFYVSDRLIGTVNSAPYIQSHIFRATGNYRVYARVYSGTEYTTSNIVQIFAIPNRRQDKNASPIISITAPTTGSINQAITISATASDSDGTVSKVEFYVNNQKIGEDTSSPYSISWTPISTGNYQLKAKVFDILGATSESNIVNFNVPNLAPTVSVSVSPSNEFEEGTVAQINATANDSDGSIASVQFRIDGINFGAPDTSSPYSISWTPIAGTYLVSAVATDNGGSSTTSSSVSVTVTSSSPNPGGGSFSADFSSDFS